MSRPLSLDLPERIVEVVEAGSSRREAAEQFEVSVSCTIKLVQRWERTGSVAPAAMGGKKPFKLAGHADRVRALLAAQPDVTLDELHVQLTGEGLAVSRRPVSAGLGLGAQKRRSRPASKAARTWPRRRQPGTASSRN